MVFRGPSGGALFCFQRGGPLTRAKLVVKLREILSEVGIDCSKHYGHSFRIGTATTAGVQDSLIKTMGRWESVAYQLYVRTLQAQLLRVLAAQN